MALQDISGLESLPSATWRALGRRLAEIGVTPLTVAPIVHAVQGIAPPLRRPARAFHLRQHKDPAGFAMRALLFQDPVTEDEARAALGDLLEPLLGAGLLVRRAGALESPFVLAIVDDLYILSDDLRLGGDAVMGLGEGTIALCRAAVPPRRVDRVLDLGCGSGTCALVFSRIAGEVVATDVNPRALALTRINTAINGVENVAVRQGSLFDPVAGEAFDRIVSQPPFVPMPEGASGATFLYGGPRGDEIALALLSGAAPRIAAGGRAILYLDWPRAGDEAPESRVRRAVGPALDVLVLASPEVRAEEHATSYAAGVHPLLDEAFERDATQRCEHLARLGIRGLMPSIVVLEHAPPARPAWTETVQVGPISRAAVTGARIDKIMAARAFAGDRDRLLAAALRVPAGTVLAEEQAGTGEDVPSTIWARFSEETLVQPTQIPPDLLGLITEIHASPSVRDGLDRFGDAYGVPAEEVMERLLPVVERALHHGLLEIA